MIRRTVECIIYIKTNKVELLYLLLCPLLSFITNSVISAFLVSFYRYFTRVIQVYTFTLCIFTCRLIFPPFPLTFGYSEKFSREVYILIGSFSWGLLYMSLAQFCLDDGLYSVYIGTFFYNPQAFVHFWSEQKYSK